MKLNRKDVIRLLAGPETRLLEDRAPVDGVVERLRELGVVLEQRPVVVEREVAQAEPEPDEELAAVHPELLRERFRVGGREAVGRVVGRAAQHVLLVHLRRVPDRVVDLGCVVGPAAAVVGVAL